MATSAEKLAELKAKKEEEKKLQAETEAIKQLYSKKSEFDNSKNKKSN